MKDKLRCLFCGGKSCKHENYLNNKHNNAIKGLNSNYITDDIIASQRPSDELIEEFQLIKTFKDLNIGMIVNLQREGEHPYCGPNGSLCASSKHNSALLGFSYNTGILTSNDIDCRCFGWKDMSVPTSMAFMLEIVKEMSQTVRDKQQKVLVHCHAGNIYFI